MSDKGASDSVPSQLEGTAIEAKVTEKVLLESLDSAKPKSQENISGGVSQNVIGKRELVTLGDPIRDVRKNCAVIGAIGTESIVVDPGMPPTQVSRTTTLSGRPARVIYKVVLPRKAQFINALKGLDEAIEPLNLMAEMQIDPQLVNKDKATKIESAWTKVKADIQAAEAERKNLHQYANLSGKDYLKHETAYNIDRSTLRIFDRMDDAKKDYHTLLKEMGASRLKIWWIGAKKDLKECMAVSKAIAASPIYFSEEALRMIRQ